MASEELVKELSECKVCFVQMDAKIYICPNGHDLCETCFEQLAKRDARSLKCPTCKARYILDSVSGEATRNRSLEHLLRHSRLPCKFADEGCDETELQGAEERCKHSAKCKHRVFKCPFGVCLAADEERAAHIARNVDCNIGLTLDELLQHCKNAHDIDSFDSVVGQGFNFELDDMSDGEGHWRMFLRQHTCENTRTCALTRGEFCPNQKCLFLMGFKEASGEISLCARTMMPGHINDEYSIEVVLPGRNRVSFTAPLCSVSEPLGSEAKQGHILKLSAEQVAGMNRMNRFLGRTVMTVLI
jgi:hypothetical protein